MWAVVFELFARAHSSSSPHQVYGLLISLISLAFPSGGITTLLPFIGETTRAASTSASVKCSSLQVFAVILFTLHRVASESSSIEHSQLKDESSSMLQGICTQCVDIGYFHSVAELLLPHRADLDSLYFSLQISVLLIGISSLRNRVLALLIELDVAENVENVQYTSTSEEISSLCTVLVDAIYARMEELDS